MLRCDREMNRIINIENMNKNKKMAAYVGVFLAFFVCVFFFLCSGYKVSASWKEDDNGKRYIMKDGKEATGFSEIDDNTYYFDAEGYLQTGKIHIEDEDVYYYADENGVIQKGIISDGSAFFITDEQGIIQTGFVEAEGKKYYFNTRAEQLFGWFKLGEDWYYADNEGVIRTGFVTIDGYRYYLDPEGKRVSDTVMEIDGTTYIFTADGSVDENATMLYPVYHYFSENRAEKGMADVLLDQKLQACAMIRAAGLVSGFNDNSEDELVRLIKNRGIKSLGGYEFSYGGIQNYSIEQLMTDMKNDDRFKAALNDADMNCVGIGMHNEDDILYFDIIMVAKN